MSKRKRIAGAHIRVGDVIWGSNAYSWPTGYEVLEVSPMDKDNIQALLRDVSDNSIWPEYTMGSKILYRVHRREQEA